MSITCDDDGVSIGLMEHLQRWVLLITLIGLRLVLMGNVGDGFEAILAMQ